MGMRLHTNWLDGFLSSVVQVISCRQLDAAAAKDRLALRNVRAYNHTTCTADDGMPSRSGKLEYRAGPV